VRIFYAYVYATNRYNVSRARARARVCVCVCVKDDIDKVDATNELLHYCVLRLYSIERIDESAIIEQLTRHSLRFTLHDYTKVKRINRLHNSGQCQDSPPVSRFVIKLFH